MREDEVLIMWGGEKCPLAKTDNNWVRTECIDFGSEENDINWFLYL